jgi:peroxiredoxin
MAHNAMTRLKTSTCLAAVFIVFVSVILTSSAARAQDPDVFYPYKEFLRGEKVLIQDQPSVDGGGILINKDLGEKTVVLAFWLNTCDLCIERMKELRDVIKKNSLGKDVAVYTVARTSSREETRMVRDAMKDSGLNWPVIADPDLAFSKQFVITMVPAFHIIAKDRTLLTRQIHTISIPIRNLTFEDMLIKAVRGETIPDLEFVERDADENQNALIGKPAPDFTASDMFGDVYSLSDYKGRKPVLLVFWHPTCPPCTQAMPYIQDYLRTISRTYDFAVLSLVNVKGESQERETKAYIQRYDLPFPVLNDADASVGKAYEVSNIPALYFVDKNGDITEIIGRIKGEISALIDPVISRIADPAPVEPAPEK